MSLRAPLRFPCFFTSPLNTLRSHSRSSGCAALVCNVLSQAGTSNKAEQKAISVTCMEGKEVPCPAHYCLTRTAIDLDLQAIRSLSGSSNSLTLESFSLGVYFAAAEVTFTCTLFQKSTCKQPHSFITHLPRSPSLPTHFSSKFSLHRFLLYTQRRIKVPLPPGQAAAVKSCLSTSPTESPAAEMSKQEGRSWSSISFSWHTSHVFLWAEMPAHHILS